MSAPAAEPRAPAGAASDRRDVDALLAVSRAVVAEDDLASVLGVICRQAARVVDAKGASILLLRDGGRFRLAGSYRLSERYRAYLESPSVRQGRGPSGVVLRDGAPVLIEDALRDRRLGLPTVAPRQARLEGFRAMASLPLGQPGALLGVLHVYRADVGPWADHEVDLLSYFAEHAETALRTAQLLDRQQRQVGALSQLVRGLRFQAHEYANRIHTISGLLALGEHERLERFVADLELRHHASYETVVSRIGHPALAGLLLANMAVAQQRGVELRLDRRSRLAALPGRLEEAEAITVLGNLLQNAFDATAELPRHRRRVAVRLLSSRRFTTLGVRDWGTGLAPDLEQRMFDAGTTTKPGHGGVGLHLVARAVAGALGDIAVRRHAQGTTITVRLPHA